MAELLERGIPLLPMYWIIKWNTCGIADIEVPEVKCETSNEWRDTIKDTDDEVIDCMGGDPNVLRNQHYGQGLQYLALGKVEGRNE